MKKLVVLSLVALALMGCTKPGDVIADHFKVLAVDGSTYQIEDIRTGCNFIGTGEGGNYFPIIDPVTNKQLGCRPMGEVSK